MWIYDSVASHLDKAIGQIGEHSPLIKGTRVLEEALKGASYFQECVFEKLSVKQAVFVEIEHALEKLGKNISEF